MGTFSDYLEIAALDHMLGGTNLTPPTIYIGLSLTDPLDNDSGISEPSGNNYARKAVPLWDPSAGRGSANTGLVQFNQASGPWGTIAYWFACDHATNAVFGTNVNALFSGALPTPKGVVLNNQPTFSAGALDVSFPASTGNDGITTAAAEKFLDHLLGTTVWTAPTTLYISYHTTACSDTTPGTEVTGGAYARQSFPTATAMGAAAAGSITSILDIDWAANPTASWSEVTYAAIHDAAVAGTYLWYGDVGTPQTPDDGDPVSIPAGSLTVNLS